jgi:hypothetical protein
MYAAPHDGSCGIHQERIGRTIALGNKWFGPQRQVTDLSCGAEAQIPRGLDATRIQLGDLAPGFDVTGPLHETITQVEPGGLFVLSETLEHLEDPVATLGIIRECFERLLLSTPWVTEDEQDANPEHVWAMDPVDLAWMLEFADWRLAFFEVFDARPHAYRWQIWGCV